MTALERELTTALRPAAQYAQAQQQQATQADTFAAAGRDLAAAGRDLAAAGRDLGTAGRHLGAAGRTAERACDGLDPGLQDARRDVTRALEMMRHAARERERGPERDFGPSR